MEKSKSQKIVKVLGILCIIGAVFGLFAAVGAFGLGASGAVQMTNAEAATGVGAVLAAGVILLLSAVFDLLEGIFALRAAKDAAKAQPLWVISIIGVVFSVISLIMTFGSGAQEVTSSVCSLLLSCLIFFLANNIKKQGKA